MNPLFLGLLAAGIALVIGVLVFNWLQERRVRRRLEAAFTRPPGSAGGGSAGRVEPAFRQNDAGSAQSASVDEVPEALEDVPLPATSERLEERPVVVPATMAERAGTAPDPDIECVMVLQPQQPVPTSAIASGLTAKLGKPTRWLGRRSAGSAWLTIDSASAGSWHEIAACLLLANRAGAATRSDIDPFVRVVAQVASALPAAYAPVDPAAEAGRADELDRFCADLDVQIGLTILKSELGQIAGTRLRGVAEAAGFRINPGGFFEYLQEETGAPLYSLQNYKSDQPFSVDNMRTLSTPGIVFLLDVPRVADPIRVFDHMRMAAKRMTKTLEGVLVDDNRRPITDASLAEIRSQVQATAAALREAHIDPGGPRAMRLFG